MASRSAFPGLTLAAALALASLGIAAGAAGQEGAVEPAVTQAQSSTPAVKSDLDQSAVRAEIVVPMPRPTLASLRGASLPKILGSYR